MEAPKLQVGVCVCVGGGGGGLRPAADSLWLLPTACGCSAGGFAWGPEGLCRFMKAGGDVPRAAACVHCVPCHCSARAALPLPPAPFAAMQINPDERVQIPVLTDLEANRWGGAATHMRFLLIRRYFGSSLVAGVTAQAAGLRPFGRPT